MPSEAQYFGPNNNPSNNSTLTGNGANTPYPGFGGQLGGPNNNNSNSNDLEQGSGSGSPRVVAAPAAARPVVPTQFQRYVLESTGGFLPQYGQSLFNNPRAYAADSAAPAPAEYILGTGDEVRIQIWGAVDFTGNQVLDRNGQINLPKIGSITLAGTRVRDLDTVLRKHISTVFTNVNVNASLGRLRGITVYVVGQAEQPGTYNLSSLSTLVNAIFASGGPSASGSMRNIQLRRGGKTVTTFDLYDFIAQGDQSKDLGLLPGDVITIPPSGPKVAVTGAWDHSAIFEIKPGSTLNDVLALGGGAPPMATPRKALLERIQGEQTQPKKVIELALDASGLKSTLQDGDIITLLKISPAFSNAVTLQGSVAAPLRYQWTAGMRLLDLIPDREALLSPDYYAKKNHLVQIIEIAARAEANRSNKPEINTVIERVRRQFDQINWDYAVIERMSHDHLRTQLIPFNLGRAVLQKDPTQNLPLLPGDVVTIMSSIDLRLPVERQSRLIKIEGEVAAPGVYQAMPGETLPQLIARIGGLTPQAYLYGTEFTRESVRRQQQQNLDNIIQKLESQSTSAINIQTANNASGDRATQSANLMQAQHAQLKTQIDKLKSMRSQGRIALELDPTLAMAATRTDKVILAAPLPAITLEDGDTVHIPSTPSFVSAVGSVNNENAILFRPGKTVGDVIKNAGLTEDAEPSEAFLVRADGTILGRRGGGFFSNFESTTVAPGDTVVVPTMLDRESRYNFLIRAVKDWTQVLANFGLGAAAIKTLRN